MGWQYKSSFDGPASHLANGPSCSQDNQHPAGQNCVYEEKLLTDAVKKVIMEHNVSEPLFLLWSMHLVHMPLEVPQEYEDKFSFIDNKFRRLNHAMGNYMDEKIGEVVGLLKEQGLWDNALMV